MRHWRLDFNQYDQEYRVYETDEPGGDLGYPVINSLFRPKGEEGKKTARLIAASPDLLEACKRLINVHTGAKWQTEAVRRNAFISAMEAVRKAEGN